MVVTRTPLDLRVDDLTSVGKGMKLEKVSAGLHWEGSGPQLTLHVDLLL